MKRLTFIILTIVSVCLFTLAQKIEVSPDGATLLYTTGTNVINLTRPQLRTFETNIVLQINALNSQLKEVQSFIALADTLKLRDVPLPVTPPPLVVTTNAVASTNAVVAESVNVVPLKK